MKTLGVNLDHVATLRQARGGKNPNILSAATAAQDGGADFITVHLRKDRRHIQESDVIALLEFPLPVNLEMAPTFENVDFVRKHTPHSVTLVEENDGERTTEYGGFRNTEPALIGRITDELRSTGTMVGLFVDPHTAVNLVEHTDWQFTHVELCTAGVEKASWYFTSEVLDVARALNESNMAVYAGHSLATSNITRLAQSPHITGFNIGHSIVSRAIFVGLEQAVREIKDVINDADQRIICAAEDF